MRKLLSLITMLCAAIAVQAQSWAAPADKTYPGETVVYASLTTNLGTASQFTIGAFIEDVCRASATSQTVNGKTIFTLRVQGGNDDLGKPISFKAFYSGNGLEYELTPTINYDGETPQYPSNAVELTLNAATSVAISAIEVGVGETVNLLDYITKTPVDGVLPIGYSWDLGNSAALASLNGDELTGDAVGNGPIQLVAGNLSAVPTVLAAGNISVVRHIQSITITEETYVIDRTEAGILDKYIPTKFTVDPFDHTDEILYEIGDPSVLTWNSTDGFAVVGLGTTTVTPYAMVKGQKITPLEGKVITLTVNARVQGISFQYPSIGANVGDSDIKSRLESILVITPNDATDPTVTWTSENPAVLEVSAGGVFTAVSAGQATIRATANDGSGYSGEITVEVHDPVRLATFVANPLQIRLETLGNGVDITSQILNNINVDGAERAGTITVSAGTSVTGNGTITANGLAGNFNAVEFGESTVMVTLDYTTYENASDPINGDPDQTAFLLTVQIVQDIKLTGFVVSCKPVNVQGSTTLVFMPVPNNAAFTPDDITINISCDALGNSPDEWKGTAIRVSSNPIRYQFTPAVPGIYNVTAFDEAQNALTVAPENDPSANGFSFEVADALEFPAGWSWKSNPYGMVDANNIQTIFGGTNLYEVRTQEDLLIDDPEWGYFGTIMDNGINQSTCFKVKMESPNWCEISDGKLGFGASISLEPGWTWVGSPYFYDRIVTNAIPTIEKEGIKIVSKTDGQTEWDGNAWVGNLKVLKSHEGYLVYNPSAQDVTMDFAPEFTVSMMPVNENDGGGAGGPGNGAPRYRGYAWQYDASRFMNNMVIVAELEGLTEPERYSIGAFVGDECRGEGVFVQGKAFITIHSDGREVASLKLYDNETGEFIDIEENFTTQPSLGTLKAPVLLHANLPEPTGISSLGNAGGQQEQFDLSGRRINSLKRGVNILRQADGTVRKVLVK